MHYIICCITFLKYQLTLKCESSCSFIIIQFNVSHHIHSLSFGVPIPGVNNPLDGTNVSAESGMTLTWLHIVVVVVIYQRSQIKFQIKFFYYWTLSCWIQIKFYYANFKELKLVKTEPIVTQMSLKYLVTLFGQHQLQSLLGVNSNKALFLYMFIVIPVPTQ